MCFSAYLVNQVPQLCSPKLGQLLLITISRFFVIVGFYISVHASIGDGWPESNSVLHKSRLYVGLGRLTLSSSPVCLQNRFFRSAVLQSRLA